MTLEKQFPISVIYETKTEEEWLAVEKENGGIYIIPEGRPIIYKYVDENGLFYRMKIGDGTSTVSQLSFTSNGGGADGNKIISESGYAFGIENVVGQKAFKILGFDRSPITGDDYRIKLSSVNGLEKGMKISFKDVYQYYNYAEIQGIYSHEISITSLPVDPTKTPAEGACLWIIDHPELGDIDIGYTASATGWNNRALYQSHAEGYGNEAIGRFSHAEGQGNVTLYCAHAEGKNNKATGEYSHAEGNECESSGNFSHASGQRTTASGEHSHTEGYETKATNKKAHAEGYRTTASGQQSHSEGNITTALGDASHAEGENTRTISNNSHAEGFRTRAYGNNSHIEGMSTTDYNGGTNKIDSSYNTWRNGQENKGYLFARAVGEASHVEGKNCFSGGIAAHTEGECNAANGDGSHAEGYMVRAMSPYQHVQGKWNVEDSAEKYAHIVGNGKKGNRSNAHTLDWDGNAWFAGDVEANSITLVSNGVKYAITINNGQLIVTQK